MASRTLATRHSHPPAEVRFQNRRPCVRRPQARFTVRSLMVLVAVLALASWWLLYRRERFHKLDAYHSARVLRHTTSGTTRYGTLDATSGTTTARGEWHRWLAGTYRRAASRPWLPVAPDPPPPSPGQAVIRDPYAPTTRHDSTTRPTFNQTIFRQKGTCQTLLIVAGRFGEGKSNKTWHDSCFVVLGPLLLYVSVKRRPSCGAW